MKNQKKQWTIDNWPIAIKLIVVYSLLISGTISIIGIVSYYYYSRSMESQIREFIPQLLSQTSRHLDTYQGQLLYVTKTAMSKPNIASIRHAIKQAETMGDRQTLSTSILLNDAIRQLNIEQRQYVRGITLYTRNSGAFYHNMGEGGVWLENRNYKKESWYSEIDEQNPGPVIFGTEELRDTLDSPFVFKIIQPIRSQGSQDVLGFLEVDGSLQIINTMLLDVNFGPDTRIFVLDHHNRIMYSKGKRNVGEEWNAEFGLDENGLSLPQLSQFVSIDGVQHLVSHIKSDQTGWKVIAVIPAEYLAKGINTVKWWTIAGIVAGTSVAIIAAILLAYSMTRRLRLLVLGLRDLEKNDFQMPIPPIRTDEVGRVWGAISKMAGRIHVLINEVYQSKILEQEAEIRSLQSQINPHFLNNSLETLRYLIKNGRTQAAEEGLIALADLFRYHTVRQQEMVSLDVEMAFMKNYLHMQKLRFGEQLQIEYDIDEEVLRAYLPGLLFQPLVENAIIHGSNQFGTIVITIRIKEKEGQLVISIIDEGKGIPPKRLNEIWSALELGTGKQGSVGLLNVYRRLRLIYKEEAEMYIRSELHNGTIVTLKFPLNLDYREGHVR
ncbi:cache domain-containing sensor histidine kinase [Cohnella silvisoli]|uniref:Sensor histidine kinase n=1 Tax=Cohnella silvisoli TaxID=2873699 RepID=A0ABV1KMH9_9BACL|nr:sensor histidine kinase [Cohnella silvisoli]MCD9020383.1 sensor histidine kinase [Cohnella silvisoli]